MRRIIWIASLVIPVFLFSCERESAEWSDLNVGWSPITDCKDMGLKTDPPPGQDCVEYVYLGDSVLNISHQNAAFNCCTSRIVIDVEYRNDTVFVVESEVDAFCDCNCLYDISYSISPVPKTMFTIHIEEAISKRVEDDELCFSLDLSDKSTGEFCVSRSGYPWR